jgi:hypothetical protein
MRSYSNKLPGRWVWAELRTLLDFYDSGVWGDSPDGSDDDFPVIRVADINSENSVRTERVPIRKVGRHKFATTVLEEADILVVKSSGSHRKVISGKAALIDGQLAGRYAFSNFLLRLRPNVRQILPFYLLSYLNSRAARDFVRGIVGTTTYPNI